jgi:hypothetical protein
VQNLNQDTPEKRTRLQVKRRKPRRIRENLAVMIEWVLQNLKDTHTDYEQPRSCRSCACPTLKKFREQFFEVNIDGGVYGVRDRTTGELMKKSGESARPTGEATRQSTRCARTAEVVRKFTSIRHAKAERGHPRAPSTPSPCARNVP